MYSCRNTSPVNGFKNTLTPMHFALNHINLLIVPYLASHKRCHNI